MNEEKQINRRAWLIVFMVFESVLIIAIACKKTTIRASIPQATPLDIIGAICWLFLFFVGPSFFRSLGIVPKIGWWLALAVLVYGIVSPL